MTDELLALERTDAEPLTLQPSPNIDELSAGYCIAAKERPSNREYLPEFLDQHQGDTALIVSDIPVSFFYCLNV